MDHVIGWFQKRIDVDGSPAGDILGVSMHRYGKAEKLFAGREEALVKLLFEELRWLHTTGRLDPVMPGVHELPPRLKEVLNLMLQGHTPKQIAKKLGLTVLTVRDHIKRLYRHLDVNGRDEMMARFVRSVN